MLEFSTAPATSARSIPLAIFTFPQLDHLDKLLWLYLALHGPADRATIAAGLAVDGAGLDIALGLLTASGLIEADTGRFAAVNEYFIYSADAPALANCPNISNNRGAVRTVDNSPKNGDNPGDKPGDNPIFSGGVKESSSPLVILITEHEENDTLNPSAKIQKPRGRPRGPVPTDDPEFDRLWRDYPKDEGKKQALDAFRKLKKAAGDDWPALYADIMAGLAHAKQTELWTKDNGSYVQDCFRWLKNGRWADRGRLAPTAADVLRPAVPSLNGHQAPTGRHDGSAAVAPAHRPPAAARRVDAANFGALDPSPELSGLIRERYLLAARGLIAADGVALDASDLLIIARDPAAAALLKPGPLLMKFPDVDPRIADAIEARPARWRIGRKPAAPDEWETELMLRECEALDALDRLGATV